MVPAHHWTSRHVSNPRRSLVEWLNRSWVIESPTAALLALSNPSALDEDQAPGGCRLVPRAAGGRSANLGRWLPRGYPEDRLQARPAFAHEGYQGRCPPLPPALGPDLRWP